jgi:hypothetical protein
VSSPTRGTIRTVQQQSEDEKGPFVYLTTVLQKYSCEMFCLDACDGHQEAPGRQTTITFQHFLAHLLQTGQVLAFDVNDLERIRSLELEEIIAALRACAADDYPRGIGIEDGRDYCLDRERLDLRRLSAKRRTSANRIVWPCMPAITIQRAPAGLVSRKPWTQVPVEHLDLKLARGRDEARQARESRSRMIVIVPQPYLPPPAASMDATSDCRGFFCLSGRMNRQGKPAMFLGDERELHRMPDPAARERIKRGRAAERYALWQEQLNEIHHRHPEKTHSELCSEYVAKLKAESPVSQELKLSPGTVRRKTRDPGRRRRGRPVFQARSIIAPMRPAQLPALESSAQF